MKKRSLYIILVILLTGVSILLSGCSSKTAGDAAPARQPEAAKATQEAEMAGTEAGGAGPQATNRKLIVKLYIELRVDNIEKGILDTEAMVARLGGYTRESYQNEHSGSLTVMIPSGKADEFTAELKGLGRIINSNRSTEDVTDSYFDTGIRIKNLETELDTLRSLLQKPGWKVSEILEIEREIRRLTDELETLKGYLNNLDRQIDYSEVRIDFEKNQAALDNANQDSLGYELMLSLKEGMDFLTNFVTGILRLAAFLLPVSPIIAIAYFVLRKPLGRFRRKVKGKPADDTKDMP